MNFSFPITTKKTKHVYNWKRDRPDARDHIFALKVAPPAKPLPAGAAAAAAPFSSCRDGTPRALTLRIAEPPRHSALPPLPFAELDRGWPGCGAALLLHHA